MLSLWKIKFRYMFNNYKGKCRAFRKGSQKVPRELFHTHCCRNNHSGIEDWDFLFLLECKIHAQLKERKTYRQKTLFVDRSK